MCECKKEPAPPCFNAYEAMVRKAEREKKCQCEDCTCEKTALQVQLEGVAEIFKGDF